MMARHGILAAALATALATAACDQGTTGKQADTNSSTGSTVSEAPQSGSMEPGTTSGVATPADSLNMGQTGTTGVTGTTPQTGGGTMGTPQDTAQH